MNKKTPYFLSTNDVELISLSLNREDPSAADEIYEVGLPRLLELYTKYGVEGTFFFTGNIAEAKPQLIEMVKNCGHEIGCHGYRHDSQEGFDNLPYEKQIEFLYKAKRVIESIAGPIVSFRSPELRIGKDTIRALESTGFEIDSSVASQRFDGPFSYGTRNKIKWLFAPRKPYFLSYSSPFRKGKSKILEIPVSAFFSPYIGTMMRISPPITRFIEEILFYEARYSDKPVVFLFHPIECVEGKVSGRTYYSKGLKSYFRDVLRQNLKMRNLGVEAVKLMEGVLQRAKRAGFRFISVKKYRDIILENFRGEA